jgi:hypothetical protein
MTIFRVVEPCSLEEAYWFSEVLSASVIKAIKMETKSASEMSVNFNHTTPRNILEDGNLHASRRENPKSYRAYGF